MNKFRELELYIVKDVPMKHMEIARREMGITEVPGKNNHPRIIEYHTATSMKAGADSVPWCSAFVNWVFLQCGVKGTEAANARSWLNWRGGKKSKGYYGDIVVFWRGKRKGWMGHVGFVIKRNWFTVSVLGGNQNNTVNVKKYPKWKVLKYITPIYPQDGVDLDN